MLTNVEANPDVTVLMPKITNWDRTNLRYSGLFRELSSLGSLALMTESHASYDEADANFTHGFEFNTDTSSFVRLDKPVNPGLVRDLTMALGNRPLHNNPKTRLVHSPQFNDFVADKSLVAEYYSSLHPTTYLVCNAQELGDALHAVSGDKVVAKPVTGSVSKDVSINDKKTVLQEISPKIAREPFLVQSFVETADGIPELSINGRHNLRAIIIGGVAVFAFGRLTSGDSLFIADDPFDNLKFYEPDIFPEDVTAALQEVTEGLSGLPDGQHTVIAADFMRGYEPGQDSRMFLCELNRRPLRNSPYDSQSPQNLWASKQWDIHEARMLHSMVD